MLKFKDILKLVLLLAALAGIGYGVYKAATAGDNKSKYSHPISRPGAHW